MLKFKIQITTGLLLLGLFVSGQQKFSLNSGTIAEKNYFTTIDFTTVNEKIIIDVEINNEKRKFLFDTGAPTSISSSLLSEIQYNTVQTMPVIDANGLEKSIEILELDKIIIGNVAFLNTYSFKLEAVEILECLKIDGIIGSNMLRNTIVDIDYFNKKIRLTDDIKNLQLTNAKAEKLIFNDNQSSPMMWINLQKGKNKVKELALFDSGDNSMYSLSQSVFNQVKDEFNVIEILKESTGSFTFGLHGNSNENRYYMFAVETLSLGNIAFKNVVSTTTYGSRSRIGAELLKYGRLILDYKNKKYFFISNTNSVIEVNDKTSKFKPTLKNGHFIFGIIWDDTLKEKINVGDQIMKIDEFDFESFTQCEIMTFSFDNLKKRKQLRFIIKDVNTLEIKSIEIEN